MSLRPKWQNIERRQWVDLRGSWLANTPSFPSIGAKPVVDLEHHPRLLEIGIPEDKLRFENINGMRSVALWEAVYLFHKCAHTQLAAHRLARSGMHSWCLFNAYHSAYIGARGTMALLGVSLPNLSGKQVMIDLFPGPTRTRVGIAQQRYQDFLLVRLPHLDQRYLWECYQRTIRMSEADCWDSNVREELLAIDYTHFSRSRNHFIYQPRYWPLDDLMKDGDPSQVDLFVGTELDSENEGFLLCLSFSVYRLFEQLITDLAEQSSIIRMQLEGSRWSTDASSDVVYERFVTHAAARREQL